MSISTYNQLQTAVASWLSRADLTVIIPDFITLGEARIAREVRSRIQEQRVTTTVTASNPYISVPSDLLELRMLFISSGGVANALRYLAPESLMIQYPSTSAGGKPGQYSIMGDEIRLGPIPDSSYTIELWYYKRMPALSTSLSVLFTDNPDLYLYAALTAAMPYLKDDKRVLLWESQYQSVKSQVNKTEENGRRGQAMQVRVA